jgi:hypothetical protein
MPGVARVSGVPGVSGLSGVPGVPGVSGVPGVPGVLVAVFGILCLIFWFCIFKVEFNR